MTKAPKIEDLTEGNAYKFLQDLADAVLSIGIPKYDYIYLGHRDENLIKNRLGIFIPFNFKTSIRRTVVKDKSLVINRQFKRPWVRSRTGLRR